MATSISGNDISLKIVVVGDTSVGKSSLIWRICEGSFPTLEQSNITVLNSLKSKSIQFNKKQLLLKFHDTAGQERFRTISRSFYTNTDIILLTYDSTNQTSFEHLPLWYNEVVKYSNNPNLYIVLVSTKSDAQQVVDSELAQKFATDKKIPFFYETSALNTNNIDELLLTIIKGSGERVYKEENWNKFKLKTDKDQGAPRKPTQTGSVNGGTNNTTEPKKTSFCIIL